ncbi:MAG: ribonuclease R [Planctomycetota bacterium]|jgi:ribonuclease R
MSHCSEEQLLAFLTQPDYHPVKSRALARELEVENKNYSEFRSLLHDLEASGRVVRLKGGRWAAPRNEDRILGRLQCTRQGYGFLIADDEQQEDLFIPEEEIGGAMTNDRIAVALRRGGRGRGRPYGVIVEILERALKRIVGVYTPGRRGPLCLPENEQICEPFYLEERDDTPTCHEDDKVLIEVLEWPEPGKRGRGFIIERLGPAGDPDTETAAILATHDAPGPFSDEVMEEVHALSAGISPEERAQRLDLTELITFTIDPETARDFDDAISLERDQDGYVLGVHIADVSHYIKPGSALDREALERSTSIYLPSRVIPMIPPELSNDLCSLRPQEERPALSVFLRIDKDGAIGSSWCHRSIIFSRRRMTYREVYDLLENDNLADGFEDKELLSRLRSLRTLAATLRKLRNKRGAIELIIPEYKVNVDDEGKAVGMEKVEHDFSHQMVEECMLAANVALATLAANHALPILYRTHDAPDEEDMKELSVFLTDCGYPFKLPFSRPKLNKVLLKVQGSLEEHAVNLAVLRAMQQAVYSPDLREHYALAYERYTHFTSPIRRYPDLHLHQILKALFPEGEHKLPSTFKVQALRERSGDLNRLGMHTSGRERRAMKIEEAVKDLRRLELLAQAKKKIHRAIITGIVKFGVFVELADYYVDGLLHRTELAKQGIRLVEVLPSESGEERPARKPGKQRNLYQKNRLNEVGVHLGQQILVAVRAVNLAERKCELEYIGLPDDV